MIFSQINKCAGNIISYPAFDSKQIFTYDPDLSVELSRYWNKESEEIRKFRKDIEKNVDSKSGWTDLSKNQFIAPLFTISDDNRKMTGYLLKKISQISSEYVAYVDSIPNTDQLKNVINDTTKIDVKSIVAYASQFTLPVNKTFLRTSFFDESSDKTGYFELLTKNREYIENLDMKRIRELNHLMIGMKQIVTKSTNDIFAASNQFEKSVKTFSDATIQIGMALRLIDTKIRLSSFDASQVAEHTKKLHANIAICKEQISNNAHRTDLETKLKMLKEKMDEANTAQIHLPNSIEKIFKTPKETPIQKGKPFSFRKAFTTVISPNRLKKSFKTVTSLKYPEKAKAFLLKTPIRKFIK